MLKTKAIYHSVVKNWELYFKYQCQKIMQKDVIVLTKLNQ